MTENMGRMGRKDHLVVSSGLTVCVAFAVVAIFVAVICILVSGGDSAWAEATSQSISHELMDAFFSPRG